MITLPRIGVFRDETEVMKHLAEHLQEARRHREIADHHERRAEEIAIALKEQG